MTPDTYLTNLQIHELEELQSDIEDRISELKHQKWKETKHTKEEIVKMFTDFGYTVPPGAKIWRVHPRGDKKDGGYGMEVGRYEHSCHIDTTDFIVLLVVSGTDCYVERFSDLWLSDPITV